MWRAKDHGSFCASSGALFAMTIFLYGGGRMVIDALVMEQTTPALGWKMGYIYLALPISGFFIVLFTIENLIALCPSRNCLKGIMTRRVVMSMIALILVVMFLLLLVMNVPIAVSIAMASFVAILASGADPTIVVASKMANGVNSFALLAIPFILSGHLMGKGMARRLIDFTATLVGFLPGGLAYVNTLTCMLFGSISGSAAAAVSSVGGFMIPEMNRKGYNREFNVAVTTTAATTGLMIPPSNVMIVYSMAAGSVSEQSLWRAFCLVF